MKKSMLFIIDSLDIAGAEKSLVTLLNLLDYTKYEVDLQLFSYGNTLEQLVPHDVNILKPFEYTNFTNLNLKSAFVHTVTTRSEEHTSELQSRGHLVCRLLLEKKKRDT